MKKTLIFFLLAIVLITPAFAINTVGIITGPSFFWPNLQLPSGTSNHYSIMSYTVGIQGEHYTNRNDWGFVYSFALDIPFSRSRTDGIIDQNAVRYFPLTFGANLGVAYRSYFTSKSYVGTGVGFSYTAGGKTMACGLYLDAHFGYCITSRVDLRFGAKGNWNFYTGYRESENTKRTGFGVAPYIAATYTY